MEQIDIYLKVVVDEKFGEKAKEYVLLYKASDVHDKLSKIFPLVPSSSALETSKQTYKNSS